MVKTLPLIEEVKDTAFLLLFKNSTQKLLPFLMFSLKVTLMVLFGVTLVVPFTGSIEVTLKLETIRVLAVVVLPYQLFA
jgi:hypothetical protein